MLETTWGVLGREVWSAFRAWQSAGAIIVQALRGEGTETQQVWGDSIRERKGGQASKPGPTLRLAAMCATARPIAAWAVGLLLWVFTVTATMGLVLDHFRPNF